jgi:phosphomannomutase
MQKHIFRKSDIRGIVGVDLMMHEIYALTQAMIAWFVQQDSNLQRIAVALDGRVHGQEIYQHVSKAITDAGYQVYFLGICPTPVFEYGLHQLPVQAGIMITASGSAAEFNGFKLYFHKNLLQAEQLEKIYQLYQAESVLEHTVPVANRIGKIVPCPIIEQYIDALWKEFAYLSEYDFSVVIDCAHGATAPVIKKLIEKMNWKQIITICDVIDGAFPVHDPEPFEIKNIDLLKQVIKKHKRLFGVSFDGDGDRIILCDQFGTPLLSEQLALLFFKDIAQRYPKSVLVCDEQMAYKIPDFENSLLCTKNSNEFIPDIMQQRHALFGAQMHGRFFFKDRHPGYPDGIYAFLRLLDILIKERKTLHDVLKSYSITQHTLNKETSIKEL